MAEQVLVFPKRILGDWVKWFADKPLVTGPEVLDVINWIFSYQWLQFMDRPEAETNFEYLQIIPYVLIKSGDRHFRYVRSKKGGEKRLHVKHSLGIGGHINPIDGPPCLNTYIKALWRELEEELVLADEPWDKFAERMVGLIYNPVDEVGMVHFGILHVVELTDGTEVQAREDALAEGKMDSLDAIKQDKDLFEAWSRAVIDFYLA